MYQPNNKNEMEQNKMQSVAEAGPSKMEVTDSDEEQELSLAEESVIEECLNDTEGSLSSVDLELFEPSPPHKRSSKNLSRDLTHHFDDESSLESISSIEDISHLQLPELTDLYINPSVEEISKQKENNANKVIPRRSSANAFTSVPKNSSRLFSTPTPIQRRIVRRKRRNSPPTKRYDKAHISSFFSAMADLVESFPANQIISAKRNVTRILHEMVLKAENWRKDTSPNKPFRDVVDDTDLLAIQLKLAEEPFHSFRN